MKRRNFLKTLGLIGGTGLLSGLYAWQIEPFWLEFTKLTMNIPNLPQELVGKKLMQISDVHVGDRFDRQYLIDSFKKAQKIRPDIVVYTGDYTSYDSEKQLGQIKEVFKHAVTGKLGTVGILGNHDYGKNWRQDDVANKIVKILSHEGIVMLRNQSTNIKGLNINGLDDYWGTNFNPQPLLNQINSSTANLVLCHNPDVVDLDIWGNYNSWILSGHTHGGQCKPPFLPAPLLPVKNRRYTSGKIDLSNNRTLYINRALGHLHQLRFNVRPEITVFELTA